LRGWGAGAADGVTSGEKLIKNHRFEIIEAAGWNSWR
jgi:hypothetical protein